MNNSNNSIIEKNIEFIWAEVDIIYFSEYQIPVCIVLITIKYFFQGFMFEKKNNNQEVF